MDADGDSDELTQHDRDMLEIATESANQDEPAHQRIERLERRNAELEAEVQDLRDELTGVKQTLFSEINDLKAKVEGRDTTDPRDNTYYEDLTLLEKYNRMSEAEEEQLLAGNSSKRRALVIFRNWTNWAREVEAGWLISTNHTRGSYGKAAIKIDLEAELGEDLQSNEVYRAMKMVAKLSAQSQDDVDVVKDSYGREHITGGAFEYHEKVNPDADGQNRKFKVLKLADADSITLP